MRQREWAVTACLRYHGTNELLDRKKPFKTYYVEADNAKKAAKKLIEDFPACDVVVAGKPYEVEHKEEDNGQAC